MGLGIVSDTDFEKELNKSDSLDPKPRVPPVEILDTPSKGRQEGSNEIPDSLRKIIGEESILNGRASALELASKFGVSPSSVSAYTNGSHSTKTYDKQPNLPHLNSARLRVQNHARAKLTKALNFMTSEKLESAKAVDLSVVARNMSSIIKDMEPEIPKNELQGPQGINAPTYIFYSPQIKTEEHYDVIQVNE